MKHFSSALAILLGSLGLALSITLILTIWVFNGKINTSLSSLLTPIETVVSLVDEKLMTLDSQVQSLETVIAELLSKTTALKTSPADIEIDTTPILEEIEARLEPSLANLKNELSILAPQVKSTVEILQLAKSFLPQNAQILIKAKVSEQVTTIQLNLSETRASLQERKADLSSITVNTDIKRIEALEEPIQELDARLSNVGTLVQGLSTTLDDVQSSIASAKRRISFFTILATFVVTLLSLWALWANFSLFKSGRQNFQARR